MLVLKREPRYLGKAAQITLSGQLTCLVSSLIQHITRGTYP